MQSVCCSCCKALQITVEDLQTPTRHASDPPTRYIHDTRRKFSEVEGTIRVVNLLHCLCFYMCIWWPSSLQDREMSLFRCCRSCSYSPTCLTIKWWKKIKIKKRDLKIFVPCFLSLVRKYVCVHVWLKCVVIVATIDSHTLLPEC